jgi:pyruvate dehydrogenase E2 component (dihydrolipoamide acetyltransferase)
VAKDVVMPVLGMSQDAGTLLAWLKREGDTVTKGEPLMEVETDKATMEVEAPASGRLANLSASAGEQVPVGKVIARILEGGDEVGEALGALDPSPVAATPAPSPAEQVGSPEIEVGVQPLVAVPAHVSGKVPASPKAKRLARERGIAIAEIAGSGPERAVLAGDVLAHERLAGSAQAAVSEKPAHVPLAGTDRGRLGTTGLQSALLERDVDATAMLRLQRWASGRVGGITTADLLVKLVAAALHRHPMLTATRSQDGGDGVPNTDIVLTTAGSTSPVIRGADGMNLEQLAARRQDLVTRAGAGDRASEETGESTFSLTDLSAFGVDRYQAYVQPGQIAAIAFGRAVERVVPFEGEPRIRPVMTVSLAFDPGAVDALAAAAFLDSVGSLIEEPMDLVFLY